MRTSYIRNLIKLVEESKIESLEVSGWGRKVRIVQRLNNQSENGHGSSETVVQMVATPVAVPAVATALAPAAPTVATQPSGSEETDRLVPIKSPMVGTFYAAPSPDAPPYVSLNQMVAKGQVVCIVEAMKLMNEIESDVSGRVVKVMVQNAQPVEFGQELFKIDPA